ncbi:MAG TPA: HD domain-containing phosphohydrolase [Anaerolineales bacterium]|jgi:putative two-component system response regulator|nr:HD domain-containing phosphohydrolase [Anaerolineales bacterium]
MSSATILIVEDNPVLRDGLQETLELENFATLTASNGREAIECMENNHTDLILSDIAMPEMDGYAFFRAVRNRPEWVAIPFIFLTARGEKEDVRAGKGLGAEDYLIKPLSHEELLTTVRSRLDRAQQLHVAQLQRAYETSLTVLANAIELRDKYTRGHIERVLDYAFVLAEQLDWQGVSPAELRFGAILHDIGKINIHEATLARRDPLSSEERAEIRRHSMLGAEMVKDIPYLRPAFPVIRYHHERWDGQGYPDGLAGQDIPFGARIVCVADCFDAMTTDRPYSPARTLELACQEIVRCSGAQFDPAVVQAFLNAWQAGRIQAIFFADKTPISPSNA